MNGDPKAMLERQSETRARTAVRVATMRSAAAYLILCGLALSPLLWASVPAFGDYPNHLARMWVLAHGRDIPELAANYVAQWRVIPNLAMDLIVPPLAHLVSIEAAGRLFLALTMFGLVGGTAALHRALHGRIGLWPLCSLLFLYNLALFYGLVNFLFGVAAFLLAFSGWIATRSRSTAPRLVVFAAVASTLFLLHLFALGLYGLCVMSYEIQQRMRGHRPRPNDIAWLCVTSLQFVPAAGLWFLTLQGGDPTYMAYGGFGAKLLALIAPWSFGHLVALDGEIVIFVAAFLVYGLAARSLKLAPDMRLPLAALVVAALAMPQWLSGSGAADIRLPVALPFVLIASTRLETSGRTAPQFFATAAVLLLVTRVVAVSWTLRDYDRQYAEFRAASAAIPEGARLLVVREPVPESRRSIAGAPSALAERSDQAYRHMAALAVIDRSVFIPFLLSGWTTVQPTARNAGVFGGQGNTITPEMLAAGMAPSQMNPRNPVPDEFGATAYWVDWPEHFDFVLWIDFGTLPARLPEPLHPLASGSFFHIYRVARP